ncbi:MAG: hypothetical protein LAN37_03785 [Acidobacteriia bacterium]|nr:hypothetical protein [Terriglobia bacterium]
MDVVGYSRLTIEEQKGILEELQDIVRGAEEFRQASEARRLIRLPTGDGMALVFFGDPEAPLRAAVELSRVLRSHPAVKLRMGIHTGPVYRVEDINANMNVAGGGVNLAQRVMDCGDAGHILVSEDTARFFSQVGTWGDQLHDIGRTKAKHGVRLHLFSLYISEVGNPQLPRKLRREKVRRRGLASVVVGAGIFVALAVFLKFVPSTPAPPPIYTQLTTNAAIRPVSAAAISPNGQYLAYVSAEGVVIQDIGRGEARTLPVPMGESFSFASPNWTLAWFPDSNRLLVSGPAGREKLESLWLFPLVGEPHKIRDKALSPAVAPDGSRIAFVDAETERGIWVMDSEEGEPRRILSTTEGNWFSDIAWSPANSRVAFIRTGTEGKGDILGTVQIATGETTTVADGINLTSGPQEEFTGLCWLLDGRILFVERNSEGTKGSDLWAIAVEPKLGTPTSKPSRLASNPGIYWADLSSTSDGKRVAFLKIRLKYDVFLGVLQDDGGAPTPLATFISEESNNWATGWTHDSKFVLFTSDRKNGVEDIYQQTAAGGRPEALATGSETRRGAVATSDGTSFLYWSWDRATGEYPKKKKLQQSSIGRSSATTLVHDVQGTAQLRCAQSAPVCIISEETPDGLRFSKLVPGNSRLTVIATLKLRSGDGYDWDLSPDGGRIAAVHSDLADTNIRVINLSDGAVSETRVPQAGNFEGVAWAADANALYVSSDLPKQASVLRVDMRGNTRVLWHSDRQSFDVPVPSPDGKQVAISISSTGESNAWLMERF